MLADTQPIRRRCAGEAAGPRDPRGGSQPGELMISASPSLVQDLAELALQEVDDCRQGLRIDEVVVGLEVEITSRRLQPLALVDHAASLPNKRTGCQAFLTHKSIPPRPCASKPRPSPTLPFPALFVTASQPSPPPSRSHPSFKPP